jgi:hypothetical protein
MVNEPILVAAKAEVHTYVVRRHSRYVHFLLSATPRGGFSGGVAIHESGEALGIVTSSFVKGDNPPELGFFAVLSIEGIVNCLAESGLYPETQRRHHQSVLGLDPFPIFDTFRNGAVGPPNARLLRAGNVPNHLSERPSQNLDPSPPSKGAQSD